MNRMALVMATLMLAACNKDNKGDDTGAAGDGGGADTCDVTVTSTVPTDGATDAYYRMDIEFNLSAEDTTATFTVTDSAGTAVDGTTWADGKTVYFTPSSPLQPQTTYTATLATCGGENNPSITFTTSELGTAAECDLTGNTYLVQLTEARFVEPAALGDLIGQYLDQDLLIGVSDATDTSLDMLGAVADPDTGGQNYCDPTIPFPTADFSESPYFSVGPEDTTLSVAGYSIPINGLLLSGTFAPDCSYFGGGVLAGELDARDLGDLVGEYLGTSDPDELCAMLAGFSVTCEACTSDGEPYCVGIKADQITAEQADGVTLECVAEQDCHEQCDASADNPECDTSNYPTCE